MVLDEGEFFECTFTRCRIVYQGGLTGYLVGCRFQDGCSFHFEEAAQRTLAFLRGMYHHLGPAGMRLVENTFNEIRRPDAEPADADAGSLAGTSPGGMSAAGQGPADAGSAGVFAQG